MALAAHSSLIKRASLALPMPYVAPVDELETLVSVIFSEVFNLDHVGTNDDFFDLGGDSLLAEALSMVLSERTGHNFPLSSLAEYGSPRKIAASLRAKSNETVHPTTPPGERIRPPIFLVHGQLGFTLPKPAFREALAEGQRLCMFELPGIRGGHCYERIEDIAAVYVGQMTAEYPQGPILLAAFCVGGLIALEMAAQLAAMGRPVCQLVLLDPGVRRDGTLGIPRKGKRNRRSSYALPEYWLKAKLQRLSLMLAPQRRTYLADSGFADDELRFRESLLRKRLKGRPQRYPELRLSIEAQAKFYAALLRYRPRPYDGPVSILSSTKRYAKIQGGSLISKFLPQGRVQLFAGHHREGHGTSAAHFMQAVFDAALAKD